MSQLPLGNFYGVSSPSDSSLQHVHKLEDYDSETDVTDVTDVEDIHPLSSPTRYSNSTSSMGGRISSFEPAGSVVSRHGSRNGFRPELDVPKARHRNPRFNRIRRIKDEEILTKAECNESPEETHIQSISQTPTLPFTGNTAPVTLKRESSVKRFKVEKGSTRKKKVHNRTQGLSMSATAVDYRQRKIVQAQYQEHLAKLLDDNIVRDVEEEGGITPLGRLYKASVRMLERVKEEREMRTILVSDVKVDEDEVSSMALEAMQRRAAKAEGKVQYLRSNLEALLKSSD